MHKKEKIVQAIIQQGVLPLYFNPDETLSLRILQSLYEAGIRVVEYTNRGKDALKNFKQLRKASDKQFPEMLLGLGTVMDKKTVLRALEAGAHFLVSPGFSEEVAQVADDENMLWIPGCMTATEIMRAQHSGRQLIKLFPANVLGPEFVKAVKEVFPELLLMPTGGVDAGNIESWFRAGVSAVGMGGSLIGKELLEKQDFELLKRNTRAILDQITVLRSTK